MSYTLHKKKTTHTHTYRIEASGTILYIFDIHMRLLVFYSHYSTETNFTIVNIVEFCATYNILHLFLTRHSNREYHNSYPLHVLPLYILARHEICKKMRKKERKKTNNGLHETYSVCVPLLTSLLAIRQTHQNKFANGFSYCLKKNTKRFIKVLSGTGKELENVEEERRNRERTRKCRGREEEKIEKRKKTSKYTKNHNN